MVICSCHRVSDRQIAQTIASGASRVGQVVRGTKAGTDCAGCLPALLAVCEAYFAAQDGSARLSATG